MREPGLPPDRVSGPNAEQGPSWARARGWAWRGSWPAACAAAAVVVAWALSAMPLWLHGFPHGHDASYELFRIAGYRNALADGQWPPYWGGEFFVGYGSPIYVFYAPAFMTLASALAWMTGSLLSGSAAAAAVAMLAAAWASYGAARAAFAPVRPALRHQLACIVAVVFVLHPYTLGTLYLRNALAEFAAIGLFPLMLWSALGTFAGGGPRPLRAALGVAVAAAAMVLTHNLSALVGVAFLLGTATVGCLRVARTREGAALSPHRTGLLSLIGGFALSLSLSAYFWVPALGYNHLTRTAVEFSEGKLDFHNNFVPWLWNFGLSDFYGAGPLVLVAIVLGLVWPATARLREPLVPSLRVTLAVFSALLLGLLLPHTIPLWEAVPFLPLMQFPFRFLGPLGFVGALCLARLLAPAFDRLAPRHWPMVLGVVLAVAGAQAAAPLLQARPLPDEVRRTFDAAATPAAIRNNPGAMATFRWEYIPPTADRELWKRDPAYRGAVHRTVGAVSASVTSDRPRKVVVDVRGGAPGDAKGDAEALTAPGAGAFGATRGTAAAPVAGALVFRRYWVPGFEARVDGVHVATEAAPDGLVAVGVPPGQHRVLLTHRAPPLREVGLAISLIALLVLAALSLRSAPRAASSHM